MLIYTKKRIVASTLILSAFQYGTYHLMVNWWFGALWFGILAKTLSNNSLHEGIPGIQTTDPNQQVTISWAYHKYR